MSQQCSQMFDYFGKIRCRLLAGHEGPHAFDLKAPVDALTLSPPKKEDWIDRVLRDDEPEKVEAVGAGDVPRKLKTLLREACGMMKILDRRAAHEAVSDFLVRAYTAIKMADTRSRPSLEWRPISTAKEYSGTEVVLVANSHGVFAARSFGHGKFYTGWNNQAVDPPPFAWMPLPSAPPPPETT